MSFGLGVHNSPVLGLGGIMAFIGANDMAFIGTTTWVGRPTSAAVGDMLLVSDIGNTPGSLFIWSGARWVTPFDQILAGSAVAATPHTGTLTPTTIRSITLPGNLLGPNGSIVFRYRATSNNSPNAKLWQLNFGGTNLYHFGPINISYVGGEATIENRNSNSSQVGNPLNLTTPFTAGVNTLLTATVDTTVDQTISFNATLSNIADTMNLESWNIMFRSAA